ncbi:MAG: rhomboid family intramembrane serine protease [Chloroflexi bacterium]|nr:rhomboid family intramembrane serine protease [Chloroflexota bacterium]
MLIIPIGDDNSDRTTTPYINYLIILVNVIVFVAFQQLGSDTSFTYAFSTVPQEIVTGRDLVTEDQVVRDPISGDRFAIPGLQPTPFSVYVTLLVSMFMHGSIAHIAGNMLFLWIFGDNVEHALGHVRYLVFYLVCGVLASLAHVFSTLVFGGDMTIPSLGASGAISGVMGGYLLMFPGRRVTVIMFRFITQVSALVAVGLWFVFQLISGLGVLGDETQGGGVAYAAHIGGFIAGLVLVKFFAIGRETVTTGRAWR